MARTPLEQAQGRLRACEKARERAVAGAGKAHAALDAALRASRAAADRLHAAQERVKDAPSPRNVTALTKAREAREVAELQVQRPREAALRADEAADSARRAVLDAELQADKLERGIELKRLRIVASVEDYRGRTANHYARVVTLLEELDGLGAAILAEWKASVDAAVECGEEPIGTHHLGLRLLANLAKSILQSSRASSRWATSSATTLASTSTRRACSRSSLGRGATAATHPPHRRRIAIGTVYLDETTYCSSPSSWAR